MILGHVDSPTGPAVFYQLPNLQKGDAIHIDRQDGSRATFLVVSVITYAHKDWPSKLIYDGSRKKRVLNLITCGGGYDSSAGVTRATW